MEPLLVQTVGRDEPALVHVLQLRGDARSLVETVDSIDPRYPRSEKSVVILSTQYGCPVACPMCDAGKSFHGNLSVEEMLAQIQFVLLRRPEILAARKLKVHFARMGEPALNPAVLEAMELLPEVLPTPHLIPCIATVAPATSPPFFERLGAIKRRLYSQGHFQLQFSINSTDPRVRRRLIPIPHLDLDTIAELGESFYAHGDRRIVLNFALAQGLPVDVDILRRIFNPEHFMVKLTPVNPTARAQESSLATVLSAEAPDAAADLVAALGEAGFETVVSIGDPEEVAIGSNCGQAVASITAAAK